MHYPARDGQRPFTRAEFGDLVGWGHTPEMARARIQTISRPELVENNITREVALAWRDFYLSEHLRVASNRNALPRAELMQRIADLLS